MLALGSTLKRKTVIFNVLLDFSLKRIKTFRHIIAMILGRVFLLSLFFQCDVVVAITMILGRVFLLSLFFQCDVVVAQLVRAQLMIKRYWVHVPPGVGLYFSSLLFFTSNSQ